MSFRQDIDGTPLLKGLPGDRCQCPHWGYVLKGRLTYRFADHEEVFEAGDAFYLPPGHVPLAEAGQRVRAVQPQRRAAGRRGDDDEEHAGDAGRLSAIRHGGRELLLREEAVLHREQARRARGSRRRS